MSKIYRRPKVHAKQIKMQRGKVDGYLDICAFFGDEILRCDRALLMNAFCSERLRLNLSTTKYEFDKSLIEELETRGYDIDTLKLSIEKKV